MTPLTLVQILISVLLIVVAIRDFFAGELSDAGVAATIAILNAGAAALWPQMEDRR